jgi:hypothetical protein
MESQQQTMPGNVARRVCATRSMIDDYANSCIRSKYPKNVTRSLNKTIVTCELICSSPD